MWKVAPAALLGIHATQTAAARTLGFAVPIIFVALEGGANAAFPLATFNATIQAVKFLALLPLGATADVVPLWAIGVVASLGQIAGAACCALFLAASSTNGGQDALNIPGHQLVAIVLLGSAAELSKEFASTGLEMRVAPALATGKDASQLILLNSAVKRVELVAKLLVPITFGCFASHAAGAANMLVAAVCVVLLTGAGVVALLWRRLPLAELTAKDDQARQEAPGPAQASPSLQHIAANAGPVVGMSLAYSMLFCSVLSDHDPMATAYLASHGVSSAALGAAGSAGALAGLLGTWIWPRLQRRFGTVPGAAVALWLFVAALAPVPPSLLYSAAPMLCFVTLSRPFLWTFDTAMVSVLQEEVPRRWRGKAASAQSVACQLFESSISALAVALSGSGGFPALACVSLAALVLAGLVFLACAVAHGSKGRDDGHVGEYRHA